MSRTIENNNAMKKLEQFFPILLVLVSVVFAASFTYVATQRTLTGLEGVLFQTVTLMLGLTGSFVFGRQSAREAAREILRPHAKSAFRRLMSLYQSLSRVASTIAIAQTSDTPANHTVTLAVLEAIAKEQLASADDALEDWRDIVPEDVKELRQRLIDNAGAGENHE